MTVRELIEELQNVNPDDDVYMWFDGGYGLGRIDNVEEDYTCVVIHGTT